MFVLRYSYVAGIVHKALVSLINEAKFEIVISSVRSKIYREFYKPEYPYCLHFFI